MESKKSCTHSLFNMNLRSSVISARNFFKKYHQLPLYEHGRSVLRLALKTRLVDKNVVNNLEDNVESGREREFNCVLTHLLLYHTLELQNAGKSKVAIPKVIEDSLILSSELKNFSYITHLVRSGASASDLVAAVNQNNPPLALPAIIVDMAQRHMSESKTHLFIKSDHDPIFRFYSSEKEAEAALRNSAKMGELLFAQIAELFGYPSLAGEIFLQSYSINHPYIFEVIMQHNKNPEVAKRADATLKIVRTLRNILNNALERMDIDFQIQLREKKNLGKQMKKLAFRLREKDPEAIIIGEVDTEKQIEKQKKIMKDISLIDFFNDFIALRIIVNKVGDKPITELDEERKKGVIDAIKDLAAQMVKTLSSIHSCGSLSNEKFYDTPRGYKSWHIDVDPQNDSFLKYEIQVRSRDWHDIAEHGEAAHYLYLNGYDNNDFIKKISAAYHSILSSLSKKR